MRETNVYEEKFYEKYVKRTLDVLFSIFAVIVLSPFALLCFVGIKLQDMSGEVLFRQDRNGRNGKEITIVKFRTMSQKFSGTGVGPTADTLTCVGRVIRKLSFDEIPQFISILRGEMSLIGPRPLLLSYYDWFNKTELRRFDVRPGLTGLSQINGRANLSWDERFAYDIEYVDNLSFLLDLKIFLKTFCVVFTHKGVIQDKEHMLEPFDVYRKRILRKKEVYVLKQRTKDVAISSKSKTVNMRG